MHSKKEVVYKLRNTVFSTSYCGQHSMCTCVDYNYVSCPSSRSRKVGMETLEICMRPTSRPTSADHKMISESTTSRLNTKSWLHGLLSVYLVLIASPFSKIVPFTDLTYHVMCCLKTTFMYRMHLD